MDVAKDRGWRGSAEIWLEGAQDLLAEGGAEAVKIGPLAARLGLSRTSFYWHFPDREALMAALLQRWQERSTTALLDRVRAPAATVTEAVLNLFDAWVDPQAFDSRAEFAVRNWALTDSNVAKALANEDLRRIEALTGLFRRFDYDKTEADTRARTVYLTQVGYIAMRSAEDFETRMARIPAYALTFTGIPPLPSEVAAFRERHSRFKSAEATRPQVARARSVTGAQGSGS